MSNDFSPLGFSGLGSRDSRFGMHYSLSCSSLGVVIAGLAENRHGTQEASTPTLPPCVSTCLCFPLLFSNHKISVKWPQRQDAHAPNCVLQHKLHGSLRHVFSLLGFRTLLRRLLHLTRGARVSPSSDQALGRRPCQCRNRRAVWAAEQPCLAGGEAP